MRSRLDDLIATAERQLASRSYDAAIDTLRTGLGEPGAAEAGVEALLDAALRRRDEARGIVRSGPIAPSPPLVEVAAPAVESDVAPVAIEPQIEPEPAPAAVVEETPIEPPRFSLVEDDPAMLEKYDRKHSQMLEVERLSILHPTAPEPEPESEPETQFDPEVLKRMVLAVVIAVAVCLVAILAK